MDQMNEKQRDAALKIIDLLEDFAPYEFRCDGSRDDLLKDFESDFQSNVESARNYLSESQEYLVKLDAILTENMQEE